MNLTNNQKSDKFLKVSASDRKLSMDLFLDEALREECKLSESGKTYSVFNKTVTVDNGELAKWGLKVRMYVEFDAKKYQEREQFLAELEVAKNELKAMQAPATATVNGQEIDPALFQQFLQFQQMMQSMQQKDAE